MSGRFTSRAPINTLPAEVLARIFALSKRYCFRLPLEKLSLYNITAVCTHWRQIAINTPSLWAHIDIGPVTPTSLTRLLLERTKDTPVHIHVYEPQPGIPSDIEYLELESRKVKPLLKPHIHRVCSLDLESYAHSTEFVGSVLNLWLDCGSANPPRSLLVYRPYCNSLLSIDEKDEPGAQASQSKNSKAMLQSLRSLHLRGAILPWDCDAYRDLTDLRLHGWGIAISLSVSQFASILSASPALVILKFAYISVFPTDGWNQAVPTMLSYLKVLDLIHMEAHDLAQLLPLIAFPKSLDDLSIGLPTSEETQNIALAGSIITEIASSG